MRKICAVQARTGSERLRGKVMKELAGAPMLYRVIERLRKCAGLDDIYVATSLSPADDIIADFCEGEGVKVYRGSERDVLGRYYGLVLEDGADIIVRITGDCPLIHPPFIEETLAFFEKEDFDYLTIPSADGLIRGLDVEIFTRGSLEKAYKNGQGEKDREHVTYYMYTHPKEFRLYKYKVDEAYKEKGVRLCVDTKEDFALIKRIYERFYREGEIIDVKEVIAFLKGHPRWRNINAGVRQREV